MCIGNLKNKHIYKIDYKIIFTTLRNILLFEKDNFVFTAENSSN